MGISDFPVAADGRRRKAPQLDGAVEGVAALIPIFRDGDGDVLAHRVAAEIVNAEAAARSGPERSAVLAEIIQAEVEVIHAGQLFRRAEQTGELYLDRVARVNLGVHSQRVAVRVLQLIADLTGSDHLIGRTAVLLHLDDVAAGSQAGNGDCTIRHGDALTGEAAEGHLVRNHRAVHRDGAAVPGGKGVACALFAQIEQRVMLGIQGGGGAVQTVHHHVGPDGRALRAHGDDHHAGALGPDSRELAAAHAGRVGHGVIGHQHDGGARLIGGHGGHRAVVRVGDDGDNVAGVALGINDGVMHIGEAHLGVHKALNGHPVAEHIEFKGLSHIQVQPALAVGVQIDVRHVIDVLVKAADRVLCERVAVQVQIVRRDPDLRVGRPLGEVPVGHAGGVLHPVEMVGRGLRHPEDSGDAVFIPSHRGLRKGVDIIGSKRARRDSRTGRGRDGNLIGLRDAGAERIVDRGGLLHRGREVIRRALADWRKVRLYRVTHRKQAGGVLRAPAVRPAQLNNTLIAVRAGHGDGDGIIGVLDPAAVAGIDLVHALEFKGIVLLGNRELQAAVVIAVGIIALCPIVSCRQTDGINAIAGRDVRQQIGLTLHIVRVGIQLEFVHLGAVYAGQGDRNGLRPGGLQREQVAAVILVIENAVRIGDDAADAVILGVRIRGIQRLLNGFGAVGLRLDDVDAARVVVIGHIQVQVSGVLISGGQQDRALGIGRLLHAPLDLLGRRIDADHALIAAPAADAEVDQAVIDHGRAGRARTVCRAVHRVQLTQCAVGVQLGPAQLGRVAGKPDLAVCAADAGADLFAYLAAIEVGLCLAGQLVAADQMARVVADNNIIAHNGCTCPVETCGIQHAPLNGAGAGVEADKGIFAAVAKAHINIAVRIDDGALGLSALFIGVHPQGFQRFGAESLYLAAAQGAEQDAVAIGGGNGTPTGGSRHRGAGLDRTVRPIHPFQGAAAHGDDVSVHQDHRAGRVAPAGIELLRPYQLGEVSRNGCPCISDAVVPGVAAEAGPIRGQIDNLDRGPLRDALDGDSLCFVDRFDGINAVGFGQRPAVRLDGEIGGRFIAVRNGDREAEAAARRYRRGPALHRFGRVAVARGQDYGIGIRLRRRLHRHGIGLFAAGHGDLRARLHRDAHAPAVFGLAHLDRYFILLVLGGRRDVDGFDVLVDRQRVFERFLGKRGLKLPLTGRKAGQPAQLCAKGAAQVRAPITGIHDPDHIAAAQPAVFIGEAVKALVHEPVVQRAHPAGSAAAVPLGQALD